MSNSFGAVAQKGGANVEGVAHLGTQTYSVSAVWGYIHYNQKLVKKGKKTLTNTL